MRVNNMAKNKKSLDKVQLIQEEQYIFPYHYLSLYSEIYRDLVHIEYLSLLNIIKKIITDLKGKEILDVGCGDGRLIYELKGCGYNLTGIDFSFRAINFSKAFNPESNFMCKDLCDIKFKKKFDLIIMMEVFEHISPKDENKVLSAVYDNLKPGGKLIITVPSKLTPLDPKHYRHFDVLTLKQIFEKFFKTESIIGNIKYGKAYKKFKKLKKIAVALYGMKNKLFPVKRLIYYIKNYYYSKIESSSPDNACRLIAVFSKNK